MSANHARTWQQTRPQHTPHRKQPVSVKVSKQGWITKGEKVIYSIIGFCIILAGIYMVSYSSSTDAINRNTQELESKVHVQQSKNEQLEDEIKELSDPDRIIRIAKKNGLKIQDTKVKQAQVIDN
ncbi:cell division protein FtsL [Virgibacillus proomii]|uniref:cell division protein FtsL n=1 Tax=Virgibacillus proomii TaxID=84407 RepID=UPI001C11DB3C|nr:cell division protein FtsL [Virgibacillus proomii]MBU5266010.1 cell division protein FtsL [Virgibacillus proomii]